MTFPKNVDEKLYNFLRLYVTNDNRGDSYKNANECIFNIEDYVHLSTKKVLVTMDYVKQTNSKGYYSVLERVACYGNTKLFAWLLSIPGINPNKTTKSNHLTPLYSCIRPCNHVYRHQDIEDSQQTMLKLLLTHPKININKSIQYGKTPLMAAVELGQVDTVKFLLEMPSIDVTKKDSCGQTALSYAYKQLDYEYNSDKTNNKLICELLEPLDPITKANHNKTPEDKHVKRQNSSLMSHFLDLLRMDFNIDSVRATFEGTYSNPKSLYSHDPELREFIASKCYDINTINEEEYTSWNILLMAAEQNNTDIVRYLLTFPKIDVNRPFYKPDYGGPLGEDYSSARKTPLMYALKHNNLEMLDLLLAHPTIDVNYCNRYCEPVLTYACKQGNLEVVKRLLAMPSININTLSKSNTTAFQTAMMHGHTEIVELLLTQPTLAKHSVRHALISAGSTYALDLLYAHPAAENKVRLRRALRKAFINACNQGELEKAINLFNKGLNINTIFEHGNTILIHSVQHREEVFKAILLCYRAAYCKNPETCPKTCHCYEKLQVNRKNRNGDTALIIAAKLGRLDNVRDLLTYPAINLNIKNNQGNTAFMEAVNNDHTEHHSIIELFLRYGYKDINAANNEGNTAFMIATVNNHKQILRLLAKQPDIDLNHPNADGNTAFMLAAQKSQDSTMELIYTMPNVNYHIVNKNQDDAFVLAATHGAYHYPKIAFFYEKKLYTTETLNKAFRTFMRASFIDMAYAEHDIYQSLARFLDCPGIDATQVSKKGQTFLHIICRCCHDNSQLTLLLPLMDYININAVDSKGNTALMYASMQGHPRKISQLMKSMKLDVYIRNKDGKTALDLAKYNTCKRLIQNRIQNLHELRSLTEMDNFSIHVRPLPVDVQRIIARMLLEKTGPRKSETSTGVKKIVRRKIQPPPPVVESDEEVVPVHAVR